jgi:hypothetical protein
LASVHVESTRVVVEVDDESEHRVKLVFEPYQSVRVTTADCFALPEDLAIIPNTVVEVTNSRLVRELRAVQRRVDETALFMEKARHFLVPAQDDFIEVVAWDIRLEAL